MNTPLQQTSAKILFYTVLTAVTILAFLPNYDALPPFVSFSDLLNHAFAFSVLYILLTNAHPSFSTIRVVLPLFLYAVWIETVQYFLPTRYASLSDIAADSAGLLIAYFLILLFRKFTYGTSKDPS